MGLLDSVFSGLTSGGGSSPIQGALMNLLGGGGQQAGTALQNPESGVGKSGGLGGLLSSFESAGLGHIAQSWVGNGPNQAVSPGQLQSVLGDSQVQNMASQSNMAPNDFLSELSQHLPNIVHGMTPNGQVPADGSVSV